MLAAVKREVCGKPARWYFVRHRIAEPILSCDECLMHLIKVSAPPLREVAPLTDEYIRRSAALREMRIGRVMAAECQCSSDHHQPAEWYKHGAPLDPRD